MSGLPPLPPRGFERRLEKRSRQLLDKIERGDDPDAAEVYKDFLIEHGNYFYSLEQVLPAHQIQTYALDSIVSKDGKKRNDYANAFLRPKAPTYLARGGKVGVQEFAVTKESMESKELLASLSSNGHSSSAKKKIWYADIFARPLYQSKNSEIAHLIPDAPAHANEWYDVACWAIGTDPEQTDWGSVFRLIHGTRGTDKKRQFGCGMRHFVANKACITGQERLIDKEDPQLLVLPIRTMEQCRDWNGEAYEAILLVGADKDGKSQEWATKAIGMTDAENITVLDATGEELQKALLLLEYCSLAMVQSLVNYSPPEVPSDATEEEKQRMHEATESRKTRMQNFISALETKLVSLPKTDNAGPTEKYRGICKIRFSNTASDNLHPSPDPMLLVSRFAVVWSVRQGFRLRASAIVQDDYDVDEWEEDVRQLQVLESLNHERRLKEEVEGLEVTVKQSGLVLDSDDETISVSSGESQEGRDIMKNMENMERAKSANPNLKMAPLAPVLDVRRTAA